MAGYKKERKLFHMHEFFWIYAEKQIEKKMHFSFSPFYTVESHGCFWERKY